MQRMTEDPIDVCQVCQAPVERVFRPVAVHFKGSGFYTTDYGRKRASSTGGESGGNGTKDSTDSGSDSDSGSGSDSGGEGAKKVEKKADSKASSDD